MWNTWQWPTWLGDIPLAHNHGIWDAPVVAGPLASDGRVEGGVSEDVLPCNVCNDGGGVRMRESERAMVMMSPSIEGGTLNESQHVCIFHTLPFFNHFTAFQSSLTLFCSNDLLLPPYLSRKHQSS